MRNIYIINRRSREKRRENPFGRSFENRCHNQRNRFSFTLRKRKDKIQIRSYYCRSFPQRNEKRQIKESEAVEKGETLKNSKEISLLLQAHVP